jgi:polysaccharide export outer membrane protein
MKFKFFTDCRKSWALALALTFVFCMAPSGMAQQSEARPSPSPSPAVPTGWSEQGITESEKAQQVTAPYEYLVGPGDVLRIEVWKEPEVSQSSITVRPDGMISLPLLGVVKVAGLNVPQVQDMLADKLSRFMTKPHVTVTALQIMSQSVYVTGEVRKPGVYPLAEPLTVLEVIVRAGGPTMFAHKRSVLVLRTVDGKMQKFKVNFKQLLHGENTEQNINLQPGDTVVVP